VAEVLEKMKRDEAPAAPPCSDSTVVGDEVHCAGEPWARVVRASCAPPDRFPATAYLWPGELACRGLAVQFADGVRHWVYKAPSLDVASPERYVPKDRGEAERDWIAHAVLSRDGSRLTFHLGGPDYYEFILATRETRLTGAPEMDAPVDLKPLQSSEGITRPRGDMTCVREQLTTRLAARTPSRLIVKLAVSSRGTPARYELLEPARTADRRLVEQVWEAIRACPWSPARDRSGDPVLVWLILPFKFN
jgi:hypothetical protein